MRVKMTIAVAALAALLLGLPASSYAHRTVEVKAGDSIQAAIDKAKPGTTIEVGEGTFKESLFINKDGINLIGEGRKQTKIVPPDPLVSGQGCVFEEPGVGLIANGICVTANFDSACKNGPEIEDVSISRLAVTGFTGFGVVFVCADNPTVTRVKANDNGEYGITAFSSENVFFARNVIGNDGEAGIYVGDSPHADATVWKNVAYGSNNGIFIRDAAHGQVLENKAFGNCAGILFLNTDETAQDPPGQPLDNKDWLAKGNHSTANNKLCPGGGDEPPVSGIGIAVVSAIDVRLIDNEVFGNKPDPSSNSPLPSGGIVVFGDPEFKPSTGTKVGFNTALGNDPFDLFWDEQGSGNKFFANDCLTSQPDGLCEDPDDNGEQGDDHAGNGGDRDHADHKKNDKKKHKHHKKHRKHKKHDD